MPRSSTRRRGVALLALATIGGFALAGCGSSDSSDAANTSADAGPCRLIQKADV